jgi:eRF1 domain 3
VQALHEFYAMLSSDMARAFYGPGHVFAAHELGAIQTLLISDTLIRVNDVQQRKKYAALLDEVQSNGGDVFVFSGEGVILGHTWSHLVASYGILGPVFPIAFSDWMRYASILQAVLHSRSVVVMRRNARFRRAVESAYRDSCYTTLPSARH